MERLEIIEALKHIPDRLERELEGLSESVLRFKPSTDDWSIKEVVGHLRDGAEVWHKRFYMVWSQTDPVLPSYDGEAYVRTANYQEADLRGVIASMRQHRLRTVDLLDHAVDWTRLGQWTGVGRRTLKQLAEALIAAEEEHLQQVHDLKQAATASSRA